MTDYIFPSFAATQLPVVADHSRLPAPIMDAIVQYMNPSELGRMARVSKGWQKIVYRPCLWRRQLWRPSTSVPHAVFLKSVPTGARHLGTPGPACFYMWLASAECAARLPRSVRDISDARAYMASAAEWWRAHRSPCCVLHHHRLTDVVAAPFAPTMTKEAIKRIILRIAPLPTPSAGSNHYTLWLNSLLADIAHARSGIEFVTESHQQMNAADPYETWFRAATVTHNEKCAYTGAPLTLAMENLRNSVGALRAWSSAMFIANEKWYKDNFETLWSTCAFGLPVA